MLNLERILNQDRLMRALTELQASFADTDRQSLFKPAARQRAPGGGRKATFLANDARETAFYLVVL
jgi:hypothetical protein